MVRVQFTWYRIADDLEPDALDEWIAAGIEKLDAYLACYAAFAAFMADKG